jgi:2-polyprenyl-3-methyl-5-hydroxy-6-metoxy-1,4-benzoquinol methylase
MTPRSLAGLTCLSCGAATLEWREGGARCTSCAAPVRIEEGMPILARNWAAIQSEIDEARRVKPNWYQFEQSPEQTSPWRHHLRKRRLYVEHAIARHLAATRTKKAARLLDLGCGDGNNLRWLSQYADHAYGSDYNLVRLARAHAQNPDATIFAADILDFPGETGAFDIVYFNHVIEHIPDDVKALTEVRRILKPGGLVVLGTPNEGSWWWQLAYRRDPQSLATTDHVHFYTAETIAERMRAAGLTVKEVHHLGWGPPDWRLDGQIRKYKFVDDAFTLMGRLLLPRQASSLYLLASA